jgi:tetratricopeptide (TPR) repeat protein
MVLLLAARAVVRNAVWWSDEALFLNLVRAAPGSAKAHYDLAYVLAEERQYARARGEYARAAEIYDDYWDAWAGKGKMEQELGLFGETEKSYKKAIAANADYENGYFGLGLAREARGNLAGAEEIYRQGLARKKDSLPLAYRLALVRSKHGWPAAQSDWKRALALGPETPSVHAGYAKWLSRVGHWEEAAKEARETLRLEPRDQDSLRLLAERDARSGRRFAEALAREKIYRLSHSAEDWALLQGAARMSEAYARRLEQLKGSLAAPAGPASRTPGPKS